MSAIRERCSTSNRLSGRVELPSRWFWLMRGFRKYVDRYLRKHFHGVRLSKTSTTIAILEGPLLIVLNHPGWWDPLICIAISNQFPGRDHFAAIDAEAVQRYSFFKKLGFVGVDSRSLRGAAEFLRTGATILAQANHTFWVTAQGRFTDVRERPLGLQSGVGHLAARMTHGTVLPIALEYTFWTERTPEALARIGQPLRAEDHPGLSGKDWTALIETALTENLDRLNAEAMSRDPSRFTDLVSGKAGVGGVYDLWRRLKNWVRGRSFNPAHEASSESAQR
jgi:1-acyl-sn-glycerol-3-phosphate acyltransferase